MRVLALGWAAAEDQDEGDDQEDDRGGELERRGPELLLGVAERAEDVDDYDQDEEQGYPYAWEEGKLL